jgi:RND family efflux transporter MFP subunit
MLRNSLLMLILLAAAPLAAQQPPASVVRVVEVTRTEMAPTVAVPGTVFSRNEVELRAALTGTLSEVLEPGSTVAAGEVVAQLDTRTLELQRAEQEALLERAEIEVARLQSEYGRQRELQETDVVSEFQLEQTLANLQLAQADARIIGIRIRQIDDEIRRCSVRAPFAGMVVARARRGGEDVARGEMLARLTDIEHLEVRAFVPLKHLARTQQGDRLNVFNSDVATAGTIRALIPSGDVRSQTFEVHIDLPEAERHALVLGQLVSVAIPIRVRQSVLAVPRDALVLRSDGTYVFRVNAENVAERVAVTLGDSDGDLIAVEGALAEGDRVAIRGAENLSDGASVRLL